MRHLLSETLQPDMGKDAPLCMNMYKLMFNTTRIPSAKTDTWATYHDDPEARRKVLVAHKNRFFIVDVYDEANQLLSVPELETYARRPLLFYRLLQLSLTTHHRRQLEKVKSLANDKEEWAVGVLTSDNRVQWAEARDILMRGTYVTHLSCSRGLVADRQPSFLCSSSHRPAEQGEPAPDRAHPVWGLSRRRRQVRSRGACRAGRCRVLDRVRSFAHQTLMARL
jgi:hypothetical protein